MDLISETSYLKGTPGPDKAMFQRFPIQIDFGGTVTHMKVCSGFLIYAVEGRDGRFLKRANMLSRNDEKDEIEVSKDEEVSEIFMDPTGDHVIIAMKSDNNYYLHRGSKTLKHLSKFNGKRVTAVAWNSDTVQYNSTGPILVGTSKGILHETLLNASEDSKLKIHFSSSEQYCKTLHDFEDLQITGVSFGRLSTNRRQTSNNVFVVVATPGKLYQFHGALTSTMEGSIFHSVFDKYKDIEDIKYTELPGDSTASQLHIYQSTLKDPVMSLAWMATPGVFCGSIDHTVTRREDSLIHDHKLVPYYSKKDANKTNGLPNSIALTEYHLLMLYKDRLEVYCTLDESKVWEDSFDERDRVKGMWRDPVKGYIFVFAAKGVYRYKVVNEARNIWKTLLKLNEYDRARTLCQNDIEKLDTISREQANKLFEDRDFDQSAVYYAQTRMSFEEVTLKFIEAKKDVALRTYLEKKLLSYKAAEDNVQMTMLVTWLVELWLNQLGRMSDQSETAISNRQLTQQLSNEKEVLQDEFRLFLAKGDIRTCLQKNKAIVYNLIASHGDVDDLVFFAELMNDYEKVISHHLQNSNYSEAIVQLTKTGDPGLIYKFSPLLMQHVPKETVEMWMTICNSPMQGRATLDPKKLIPSLVQYEVKRLSQGQTHETIRFLEFCIRKLKNRDQALHNYLISLYAEFDHDKLLQYLKVQGQDADSVNYDLKYALRLCSEKRLHKACIHIYSTMGLYSEAVNLALTVDLGLAQENADKPTEDEERKKLWLNVARHVVQQKEDIDTAMKVLKDCDLLKIEDILPFFPDFVTIDKFKEAITQSLTDYNEHINSLKQEMDEATKNAEKIRGQIQDFRKRSGCVRTTDICYICDYPLITRSFYLFPCQHKFHSDCLIAEVLPTLTPNMRARVEDLQRRVASREDTYSMTSVSSQTLAQNSPKRDLDELVASECIYCGEAIIRTIDEPFISPDEYADSLNSW